MLNLFYRLHHQTLKYILEETGQLDWGEMDELGETMQTQNVKNYIFADSTIALKQLLEHIITHSCLTSNDLIRNLAIMKKFLISLWKMVLSLIFLERHSYYLSVI